MSAEDCWRNDRADLAEQFSAQRLALGREPSPLVIVEAQPSPTELLFEAPVFLAEILDHMLLLPVEHARHDNKPTPATVGGDSP